MKLHTMWSKVMWEGKEAHEHRHLTAKSFAVLSIGTM